MEQGALDGLSQSLSDVTATAEHMAGGARSSHGLIHTEEYGFFKGVPVVYPHVYA